MPSSLRFFRLISKELRYGPATMTRSVEQIRETETQSFIYAHNENTSTHEFSMSKEVSVSGVLKAFDISNTRTVEFAKAYSETISTGSEITETSKNHLTEINTLEMKVPADEFYCEYAPIEVFCFTVNGGKKQYASAPKGPVSFRSLHVDDLTNLSNGTYLMDSESWGSVVSEFPTIKLDNIKEALKNLDPKNITTDVPYGIYKIKTTSHEASGCPAGWGLAAWREADANAHRNDSSTWVGVHAGDNWPCLWEIKAGRVEGTYRIETVRHTLSQQPGGWGLSAFPKYGARRNSGSTKIAVHTGDTWPMDWKIVKANTGGTYRILTTEHYAGGQVKDWGLCGWGSKVGDTYRSSSSSWVHVHEGNTWPMDWVLEKQE